MVKETERAPAGAPRVGRVHRRLGRRRPGDGQDACTSSTASRWSPTARTSRRRSTSGSFDIIDCESRERALEIAAHVPFARVRQGRGAAADARGRDGRVSTRTRRVEDLLRGLAPQVLGALVRRYGHFDACEDAVQEALLAAARAVARAGRARRPEGLADHGRVAPAHRRAAQRRVTPAARGSRRRRAAASTVRSPDPQVEVPADADDTLTLLFLCCHPALSASLAARAHAAGGRRTHHRGDRRGVPRPRGDDGAAHQPGQAAVQAAGSAFAMPPAPELGERLARGAARALPDLQRGLHRDLGSRPGPRRPHRARRSASPARSIGCCPTTARSPGSSR